MARDIEKESFEVSWLEREIHWKLVYCETEASMLIEICYRYVYKEKVDREKNRLTFNMQLTGFVTEVRKKTLNYGLRFKYST